MRYIDCTKLDLIETNKMIWELTDNGYSYHYSRFDNPVFTDGSEWVCILTNKIGLTYRKPKA